MIVFIDPYGERGGGQAVLEELLSLMAASTHEIMLGMPTSGRSKISVPATVKTCEVSELESLIGNKNVVLVSNANASHISVMQLAWKLRRRGIRCRTLAILHNYPRNTLREFVIRNVLRQYDTAIAVEPGLLRLRSDAVIPSWLSAASKSFHDFSDYDFGQRVIKCFARPDPSKGLHLLPSIFRAMDRVGYSCHVALGDALESNSKYVASLRAELAPWLVEGRRSPDWLEPGDVFVIPSIYGEAACLSAQEAMTRGAFVVASRVGLMPYLSPTNEGIRTFAVGSSASAVQSLRMVADMGPEEYRNECISGALEMAERNGRWYAEVSAILSRDDLALAGSSHEAY